MKQLIDFDTELNEITDDDLPLDMTGINMIETPTYTDRFNRYVMYRDSIPAIVTAREQQRAEQERDVLSEDKHKYAATVYRIGVLDKE